ncbi:MAG: helix-turn-helix transcriptional regulator [Halieaceae bacterium]
MELSETKARIRRLMKREDITIEAAAKVAGVSTSTVRRWCNPSDDTDIGLHAFSEFAHHFDVSMDALMFPKASLSAGTREDINKLWRSNMDWWDVHLSAEQKEAVLAFVKAVWQVSSATTTQQLRMTDPQIAEGVVGVND